MAPNPKAAAKAGENLIRTLKQGDNVAGYLEYKPGPGIYSRLERAVQQLPENVRVQELPGLLKRYKDGIPGWELKAVDLDSIVAGRNTVPRDELLAAVRERSPVFTTREVRLSENAPADRMTRRKRTPDEILFPALEAIQEADNLGFEDTRQALAHIRAYPDWRQRWEMTDQEAEPVNKYLDYLKQQEVERTAPQAPIGGIGAETPHGITRFHDRKPSDATNYTELVFLQPNAATGSAQTHHWHGAYPQPWGASRDVQNATTRDAVSHMRFADHGDALRLLESQSDLHNSNIKAAKDGKPTKPYSLEQAQAELDAKRLLLEAARTGKSAVEIASPEWISESVGMPLEHAQHRYGKVLASEIERAARKLGGFVESPIARADETVNTASAIRGAVDDASHSASDFVWGVRRKAPGMGTDLLQDEYDEIVRKMTLMRKAGHDEDALDRFLADSYQAAYKAGVRTLTEGNMAAGAAKKQAGLAVGEMIARAKAQSALEASMPAYEPNSQPGRRWGISDEMRRNIITKGIPAAVMLGTAAGVAGSSNTAQGAPKLPL